MCCEHLVCASCAHAVVDARCPTCRGTRDRLHRQSTMQPIPLLLVLAVLATLALALSAHLTH